MPHWTTKVVDQHGATGAEIERPVVGIWIVCEFLFDVTDMSNRTPCQFCEAQCGECSVPGQNPDLAFLPLFDEELLILSPAPRRVRRWRVGSIRCKLLIFWSGRPDSNRRRPAWESRQPFDINNINAQVFGSGASNTLEFSGCFSNGS